MERKCFLNNSLGSPQFSSCGHGAALSGEQDQPVDHWAYSWLGGQASCDPQISLSTRMLHLLLGSAGPGWSKRDPQAKTTVRELVRHAGLPMPPELLYLNVRLTSSWVHVIYITVEKHWVKKHPLVLGCLGQNIAKNRVWMSTLPFCMSFSVLS